MTRSRVTMTAAELGKLTGMSAPAVRRMLRANGVVGTPIGTGRQRRYSVFELRRKLSDVWDGASLVGRGSMDEEDD